MQVRFTIRPVGPSGPFEVLPIAHEDARGDFLETWRESDFRELGLGVHFVQDNQSKSRRSVLRGLHFQRSKPQGKLVRAVTGEVFDVVVDLRAGSPDFGRWWSLVLSGSSRNQLYVPPGFAHGYLVLSDEAIVAYRCSDYYDPADEGGLRWDDPTLGIDWPDTGSEYLVSERDRALPYFRAEGWTP